ncbi:MAG TPA: hypothetical protein PK781_06595 [Terrimesophilobacter sp.]|nr:hypothetical protein [Terrimesophilobacter sp.]HRQ00112.1 hypothetical protein [Terrimesophilobacter sp.]
MSGDGVGVGGKHHPQRPSELEDDAALSWGGESDTSLVTGPRASAAQAQHDVDDTGSGAPRDVAGSVLLVFYGITAGVYVLYTVGWVLGAFADTTPTVSVFAQLMHEFGLFCAIAAPALWALAVFVLAQRPLSRVLGLILGMVLLVPWPFVLGAFQ